MSQFDISLKQIYKYTYIWSKKYLKLTKLLEYINKQITKRNEAEKRLKSTAKFVVVVSIY